MRDVSPERTRELFTDPAEAAVDASSSYSASGPRPKRLGQARTPRRAAGCRLRLLVGRRDVDGGRRASLELIAKGRELGQAGRQDVALVLGHDVSNVADELAQRGAEEIVVADDPALAEYEPVVWASALEQVLRRERPHVLLIPATSRGRDYGPRAAGALELGMTGDCVGLGSTGPVA